MSEKRFGLDVVSVELKRERELLSEEPVNTPDRAVLILQGYLEYLRNTGDESLKI